MDITTTQGCSQSCSLLLRRIGLHCQCLHSSLGWTSIRFFQASPHAISQVISFTSSLLHSMCSMKCPFAWSRENSKTLFMRERWLYMHYAQVRDSALKKVYKVITDGNNHQKSTNKRNWKLLVSLSHYIYKTMIYTWNSSLLRQKPSFCTSIFVFTSIWTFFFFHSNVVSELVNYLSIKSFVFILSFLIIPRLKKKY